MPAALPAEARDIFILTRRRGLTRGAGGLRACDGAWRPARVAAAARVHPVSSCACLKLMPARPPRRGGGIRLFEAGSLSLFRSFITNCNALVRLSTAAGRLPLQKALAREWCIAATQVLSTALMECPGWLRHSGANRVDGMPSRLRRSHFRVNPQATAVASTRQGG